VDVDALSVRDPRSDLLQAVAKAVPDLRGLLDAWPASLSSLPDPVVERLRATGVFRMALPTDLGGMEADPLVQLRAVELLAEVDASLGPGGLSDIGAAADGTVWGVNSGNHVFRYTGDQDSSNPWKSVNGSLKRIAVGSRTNVWGVDPAGKIYKYTNNDASGSNPWVNIPGTATDIAAGADGTVWHINSAGAIYRYTGDQPS
jgi:hypothetical protein